MEIKTVKQENERKGKIIRNYHIARSLLKCDPQNTIIDIKIDKEDPDRKRTVYVFEDNEKFQTDLARILKEREEYRIKEEVRKEVEARLKKIREQVEGE